MRTTVGRALHELAKQQLKLHIALQKGLQRYENFAKKTFTENEASSTDSTYSSLSSIISNLSSSLPTKTDTDNISDNFQVLIVLYLMLQLYPNLTAIMRVCMAVIRI